MVWYQLSNLLLYKHELLLSKCPLTADWLLIRPVWNEISNEPVKYDPIPERIISNTHTHTIIPSSMSLPCVYFCLPSFYLLSASPPVTPHPLFSMSLLTWPFAPSLPSCFPSLSPRMQLQRQIGRVRVWHGAVPQHRQWGAVHELQGQHWRTPLWTLPGESLQEILLRRLPFLQLQRQR